MDKYTKFILTVIAVALIGILFKGAIITPAEANSSLGRLNKIIFLSKFVKVKPNFIAFFMSL